MSDCDDITGEYCRKCGSQNLICGDCNPSDAIDLSAVELRDVAMVVIDGCCFNCKHEGCRRDRRAAEIFRKLADAKEARQRV